ncbi:MAG: protein-L-isoaspartate(D-aspartate) O-methyltransferase [Candidatus Omnitrophica bacterium]|nr:protein-L-isoaspartate(D-aspartate) O-methyltransferase [Candidatus Omnitrophota bacterium]
MSYSASIDFDKLRAAMVTGQLISRNISDSKVLETFRRVPRHEFVPEDLRPSAYNDYPLPIGENQTISQPYMVALMTESLKLKGAGRVLEVGTGSGYQAAILGEMSGEVYSVERFKELADRASRVLSSLGYKNIHIKVGDGTLGWSEFAPYDGIVVTAGAPAIPESLVKQLKDGGRLVIPVDNGVFGQTLKSVERTGRTTRTSDICACKFVPLVGKEGWPE